MLNSFVLTHNPRARQLRASQQTPSFPPRRSRQSIPHSGRGDQRYPSENARRQVDDRMAQSSDEDIRSQSTDILAHRPRKSDASRSRKRGGSPVQDTGAKRRYDAPKPEKEYTRPLSEGQFWSISQQDWERSALSMKVVLDRARKICETPAGKVADVPCAECAKHGIPCMVFVHPRDGVACAGCVIQRGKPGCPLVAEKTARKNPWMQ